MIVGSKFPGDDNDVLMWVQHDLYGSAVGRMFGACKERYMAAISLTGASTEPIVFAAFGQLADRSANRKPIVARFSRRRIVNCLVRNRSVYGASRCGLIDSGSSSRRFQ